MFVNQEDLRPGFELPVSPVDAFTIINDNGFIFVMYTKKGQKPTESKRIGADDLETVFELIRGLWKSEIPKVEATPVEDTKRTIGFLAAA